MKLKFYVPAKMKPLLEKRAKEQGKDIEALLESFMRNTVYPAMENIGSEERRLEAERNAEKLMKDKKQVKP